MWQNYGKDKEFGGDVFRWEEGKTTWKWHCRQGRQVATHYGTNEMMQSRRLIENVCKDTGGGSEKWSPSLDNGDVTQCRRLEFW